MDVSFWTDERGLIRARVPESRALEDTLNDSISSLAPRGRPAELSTFWIDHVLGSLDRPSRPDSTAIGEGNFTAIVLDGSRVRAEALYDTFDPMTLSIDEFRGILDRWRSEVTTRQRQMGSQVREDQGNYQRNPPRKR